MKKSIGSNVREVRARMAAAAARAGRDPERITLLAATKNRQPEEIIEAVLAGVRVVGENRVQELLSKQAEVGDRAEWHFIGHLQKNKVKYLVGDVRLIHSVDSVELAREIDRRAGTSGLSMQILLQVNVAGEQSKSGLAPDEVKDALGGISELGNVECRGLSTIAPLVEDPREVRGVFRRLRALAREMEGLGLLTDPVMSMGMTNDFEVAIEEGSTIIRIGSAIFERDPD